jgi:hypothetical protein
MAKLTLNLDDRVITGASRCARRRGISVSKMVEDYLAAVADSDLQADSVPPILSSLRGILQKADMNAYRRHLSAKFR